MSDSPKGPSFRHQLVVYLPLWVEEGLINEAQAQAIAKHHSLGDLAPQAPRSFSTYVLITGAVLLGLGLISFVAANWALIPEGMRCLGALLLMVGFQWAGVRASRQEGAQGKSTAYLMVGHLLVGANIGLLAQWFQIDGDGWGLFLGWSLACAASAIALRHPMLGALGSVLWLSAYTNAPQELWWAFLAASALLWVPLGRWLPSAGALWLSVAASLVGALAIAGEVGPLPFTATLVAATLGWWSFEILYSLRAGASHVVRQRLAGQGEGAAALKGRASILAPLVMLTAMQIHTWEDFWKSHESHSWAAATPGNATVLGLGILACLGLWAWVYPRSPDRRVHLGFFTAGLMALLLEASRQDWTPFAHVVLANLSLIALSLGLAAVGLWREERGWFWLGFLSFAILVICRFFEYTEGLMVKAAVFSAWGAVLMLGGRWAEKRFHQAQTAKASGPEAGPPPAPDAPSPPRPGAGPSPTEEAGQ